MKMSDAGVDIFRIFSFQTIYQKLFYHLSHTICYFEIALTKQQIRLLTLFLLFPYFQGFKYNGLLLFVHPDNIRFRGV